VCFGISNLLAVELEHVENHYTGRVLGTPTFREGKVIRLMEWLQETGHSLEGGYFYSDSHNDLPLLQLVENPVAVDPDPILHAHAQVENWPVLRLHSSDYMYIY
jgi:phosphoserine phosphatase